MTRALCALAAVATLAGGCASRGTVSELGSEVGRLRSELSELRLVQEVTARDLARVAPQIEALDARTSETQSSMRTLTEDVTRLARRSDAVDTSLGETRARVEALTPTAAPPSVAAPMPPLASSAVDRPLVAAPPAPSVPPATAPVHSVPPAPIPPAPAAPPPAPVASPSQAVPPLAAPRAGNPEHEYNAALATFRSGEHGQAVLDFIDFIAKYPKHWLAGNAQYWIGEAYWAQRDYRQALIEFEKVSEYGPGKVPDALVKVGLCHVRLRDVPRAQQAWQRVVRDYPKSEAAVLAQSLMRTHAVVPQ
jgi:tol-pal system protein YbgF